MNKWTLTRKREQASERARDSNSNYIWTNIVNLVNFYDDPGKKKLLNSNKYSRESFWVLLILASVYSDTMKTISSKMMWTRRRWEKKTAQNKRCSFWLNLLMCMYGKQFDIESVRSESHNAHTWSNSICTIFLKFIQFSTFATCVLLSIVTVLVVATMTVPHFQVPMFATASVFSDSFFFSIVLDCMPPQ